MVPTGYRTDVSYQTGLSRAQVEERLARGLSNEAVDASSMVTLSGSGLLLLLLLLIMGTGAILVLRDRRK